MVLIHLAPLFLELYIVMMTFLRSTSAIFLLYAIPIILFAAEPSTPLSPTNNATNISSTEQSFNWTTISAASAYRIVVSRTSNFDGFVDNDGGSSCADTTKCQTGTSSGSGYAGFALEKGTKYYWKTRSDVSGWSVVSSFTTETLPIPLRPSLISPLDNSEITDTTPYLDWSDVSDATSYKLYLINEANGRFVHNGVSVTSSNKTSAELTIGETYRLWVTSCNSAGCSSQGSVYNTFTVAPPVIAPSTLLSPTNNATNISSTEQSFNWTTISAASAYRIVVSRTSNFDGFVDNDGGSSCADTTKCQTGTSSGSGYAGFALEKGTKYYWKTRSDVSGWSVVSSFTTETANQTPALSSQSATPSTISLGSSTILESIWADPEGQYIVNVRARYRLQGSGAIWTYVNLRHISGYTFNNSITPASAGTYEYEFQASDAINSTSSVINTTAWLSGGTFGVIDQTVNTSTLKVNTQGQGKVFSSPSNEIDCGSICNYEYINNTEITLIATAETGWDFSAWNYDRTLQPNNCTTASCELLIKENFTLTAVFIEQETPSEETKVTDFTPKRAPRNSATTFTLTGENLTDSIIANIEGTNNHCQLISFSKSKITLSCTPSEQGQKRLYLKDSQGENKDKAIAGSQYLYIEVTPPINNNAPSVWIDNLPDYITLDQQFLLTVKSEDIDNNLFSIQADWENDNNLDRIVYVNNTAGQDVHFSYTRSNNDLSDLAIRFIATDTDGNQSYFKHVFRVIEKPKIIAPVSGVEGKDNQISKNTECVIDSTAVADGSNPILASSGAKVEDKQLLSVNGIVPVTFNISYNSLIRGQSGVGVGWVFANAYAAQISESPNGDVTILWSDNQQHKFTPNGDGTYATQSFGCRLDRLTKLENGGFKVERRNRLTYIFNEFNFLTRIENAKAQGVNFEFDQQSRLIKAYEPISNASINYLYDTEGFLTQATSSAGRVVLLEYQNKQLTKITHVDGVIEEFTYNELDQIIDHYLDNKIVSTTTYDEKGRATQQNDSRDDNLNLFLTYEETDDFITTTITNRNGDVTVKKFDKNYQLVNETNALNEQRNIEYNGDGKPTKITNARGFITAMEYNQYGDITQLLLPNGATDNKQYDANRNLIKHTNALIKNTTYTYFDNTNNVATATNALGFSTNFTYNTNNQQKSVTTAEGRTTYYGYTNGLVSSATNPEGYTRHIYYDLDGYTTSETDYQGNETSYERDGFGRVIQKVDPLGNTEAWTYDARGNVLTYLDAKNRETSFEYNGQGDLTQKIYTPNDEEFIWHYKYDGESRLIESILPDGSITKLTLDALGRMIETTDALGNSIKAKFDKNGNLIEATDALNNVSTANFDEVDQVTSTIDALNNTQSFTYNLLGQVKTTTNALSQLWKNTYDELSRLVSIDHPSRIDMPIITHQAFDKDNNIISITTPSSDIRKLELNENAQVSTETTADNVAQNYFYNENSLIETSTNGRNQQTNYVYDEVSLLKSFTDDISTISYGYDETYSPLQITENDITITRQYDSFDRVIEYKQTDTNFRGINFVFDKSGNVAQLDYINDNGNQNLPIKYTYDLLNRVKTVSGLNQDFILAEYEYDNNHNITKVIRANGTVLSNEYDVLNRLMLSTDRAADGTIILQQRYAYNAIGQLTEEHITPEPSPPAELLAEQIMTYTADNRIATKNSESFDFDGDGNTLNIGDKALKFNARNQLESAGNHEYGYNAEGMRVSKIYNNGTEQEVTRYSLLPDYLGLPQIAWEAKATNGSQADYNFFIYSAHGLIAQRTSKANEAAIMHYFHFDYRGSVAAITDENGIVVARFGYTAFGQQYAAEGFEEANKEISTPFGYNGRDGVITDSNGLIYMRARYYSPELRRFVSKDPLRGNIGDLGSLNRYAYVGGDPVNFVDPSGESAQLVCGLVVLGLMVTSFDDVITPAPPVTKIWVYGSKGLTYTIGSYNKIKGTIKGFEAHHLIPQRLLKQLGISVSEVTSISLNKLIHRMTQSHGNKTIANVSNKIDKMIINKFGIKDGLRRIFDKNIKDLGRIDKAYLRHEKKLTEHFEKWLKDL